MKRLLGLLTTWSERIISVAPSPLQQRARRNADRLLRLVGGNPNWEAPSSPRRSESSHGPHQSPALHHAIRRGQQWLLSQQAEGGYWIHELEVDTTLTSEWLMLRRFMGFRDPDKEAKAARYLIESQLPNGGWPIYHGGPPEISASVKAYFALKLSGIDGDEPFMRKARAVILQKGGVVSTNVFTKIALTLFDQYDWRGIPTMPAELALLPSWFYFNIYALSYWSRTVLVPLLIIFASKPICQIPKDQGIDELYSLPREHVNFRREPPFRKDPSWLAWHNVFITLDGALRVYDRLVPRWFRNKGVEQAARWMVERMEGEGGLGAIYPAMANSVLALHCLGYADTHPLVQKAFKEIEALEVDSGETLRLQPCFSPIWDTPLTMSALIESGVPEEHPAFARAAKWLISRQCQKVGDWIVSSPRSKPGGWYFQFENESYPDNDDTAAVLIALSKIRVPAQQELRDSVQRGLSWTLPMQGSDGGWGAYDRDNNRMFFNDIPFADHRALLDPSTADVTGRELEMMGALGYDRSHPIAARAIRFLKERQEKDGSWYGRWGVNYVYGVWSVLAGLKAIREDMQAPYVRRAVAWIVSKQNHNGGWGESCQSYGDERAHGVGESAPSQTAWALLGLLAAGEVETISVYRGINYLLRHQNAQGHWSERNFTGTGFPRVFYLRYHGYCHYFPLWALSMYRSLKAKGQTRADEILEQNRTDGQFRLAE